jgi:hypothetical protein
MIAFEIEVNGISLATAGTDDLSVLTAMIDAVGKLGSQSQGSSEHKTDYHIELSVGGLTARAAAQDEHLKWIKQNLKPGDVVTIKILESTAVDAPMSATPARTEEDYKLQFEWAKKVYLENRDKFEGSGKATMKDEL